MVTRLKQLTLKIKLTLYICQTSNGKMYTIHEGKSFEGALPEWMERFVTGTEPLLAFEQDGQHKTYVRWVLNTENTIVFLDDAKLSGLMLLLNNLLSQSPSAPKPEEASAVEIRMLTEKLQQMKLSHEAEIDALNENSLAQIARLKEALSKATSNAPAAGSVAATGSMSNQTRSALMQLKDENSRLVAVIRAWEEKYKKLESQLPKSSSDVLHGLAPIIAALNKVIVTGDSTGLNIDALNLVISTPPKAELETNPEAVKAIIAKLVGMERSGQLTAFQIKKLNNAMR
jgi:hypothetical protein